MTRQQTCVVRSVRAAADNIFVLSFHAPEITRSIQPGQFLNIRVADGTDPLLRRPFSIYRADRDCAEIIFNVVGRGTAKLRRMLPGDFIDVLGPLGVPFNLTGDDIEEAVLVGGGLGVAPLPIATTFLKKQGKKILTLLGTRSASVLVEDHLENLRVATDDGSKGFHGTVVDLLRSLVPSPAKRGIKIYGCGPTAMLRALAGFVRETGYPCEVSLEGPMACGIGICQGCPVELVGGPKTYALMCKDGPVFDIRRVKL